MRCQIVPKNPCQSLANLKVYDTQRTTRRVSSGPVAWGGEQETAIFALTPRRAGFYAVRYEQEVIDFFGRTNTAATATTSFNAR